MSIDLGVLESLGQVAGVAGIAIGVFLFVSRDLIAKSIFPTLTRAHSTKIILALSFMAWTVALAGIGSWTYVETRRESGGDLGNSKSKNIHLPGETGWIFAGYFNIESGAFIEGPYVSVYDSSIRGQRKYVEIGDIIQLRVSRKLIVVDFKSMGVTQKLVSPVSTGILSEKDETGIIIPKDTRLLVRDVSEGYWPDSKNAALWLRIINVPE